MICGIGVLQDGFERWTIVIPGTIPA
jgi:hypothetical protein